MGIGPLVGGAHFADKVAGNTHTEESIDMVQRPRDATQAAIEHIMEWARRPEWSEHFEEVLDEHVGGVLEEFGCATFDDLAERLGPQMYMTGVFGPAFEDFLTRRNDEGECIVEEYLRRRGYRESVPGRRYLEALRDSTMSLYEVLESAPGSHLVLRDRLRGGEPLRVEERSGSKYAVRWDRLAARVLRHNNRWVMSGAPLLLDADAADRLEKALGLAAHVNGATIAERLGAEAAESAAAEAADARPSGAAVADDIEREPPAAPTADAEGSDDEAEMSLADLVEELLFNEALAESIAKDRAALAERMRPTATGEEAERRHDLDRKVDALLMGMTLLEAAPIFTRTWLAQTLGQLEAPPPQLFNTDGEPMVFVTARWPIVGDAAEIARRLSAEQGLSRHGEDADRWTWQGDRPLLGVPPAAARAAPLNEAAESLLRDPDKVSLGSIEIEDGTLTLATNSEARAERGRAMLESLLAGLLGGAEVERETAAQMWERNLEDPPLAPEDPEGLTPELKTRLLGEVLGRHYRTWPDRPLPALDGETPREAARTEDGRLKLARLLKQMENHEARRARSEALPPYDFGWMWHELGVSPDQA